jgi:hypothetical protein
MCSIFKSAVILILISLLGCGRNPVIKKYVAIVGEPKRSPSGSFALIVQPGYDGNVHFQAFQILENPGTPNQKIAFFAKDRFRTRDALYFGWDDSDNVWVYSGDLGTFFWRRSADGRWEKHVYREENIPAPPFLKILRPQFFSNK